MHHSKCMARSVLHAASISLDAASLVLVGFFIDNAAVFMLSLAGDAIYSLAIEYKGE